MSKKNFVKQAFSDVSNELANYAESARTQAKIAKAQAVAFYDKHKDINPIDEALTKINGKHMLKLLELKSSLERKIDEVRAVVEQKLRG